MSPLGRVGLLLAFSLAVAGCGGSDENTMTGEILYMSRPSADAQARGWVGQSCADAYSTFGDNMTVTVAGGTGEVLGTAATSESTWVEVPESGSSGPLVAVCRTTFEVVAAASDVYTVSIGDAGDLSFGHDELEADGFAMSLSL